MFKVIVKFENNVIPFTFGELCDAVKFVGDCIETAEYTGTEVTIFEEE